VPEQDSFVHGYLGFFYVIRGEDRSRLISLFETIGSFARNMQFNPWDVGNVTILDLEMQSKIIINQGKRDETVAKENPPI
jgi:hypothetical protein